MLIEKDVFQLQIPVNTGHVMYVAHGTNELCKYLLRLLNWERSMLEKIVVQLIACV